MVFRIVARLDVKPPNLVKGVHLEGFRKVGDPANFAFNYFQQGVDEISYQDIVASLYGFNSISELISATASNVFLPLTVGGGIRSVADSRKLLQSGADKVCMNTATISNPKLIRQVADAFGQQAVVVGIEAKRSGTSWLAMTDNGREHTNMDAIDLASRLSDLGAGEIFLTSIDAEGTEKGFDLDLIESVRKVTPLSLIAHGGMGCLEDAVKAHESGADGIAIASVLHWGKLTVSEIKTYLTNKGISVRNSN
jgi:cyclase